MRCVASFTGPMLVISLSAIANAALAADSPKALVDEILNKIIAQSKIDERGYLEGELAARIAKLPAGDDCFEAPGLLPALMGGQDADFKTYASSTVREDANDAAVRVKFTNYGEPVDYMVKLSHEDGAWKIADVCGPDSCLRADVFDWKCQQ